MRRFLLARIRKPIAMAELDALAVGNPFLKKSSRTSRSNSTLKTHSSSIEDKAERCAYQEALKSHDRFVAKAALRNDLVSCQSPSSLRCSCHSRIGPRIVSPDFAHAIQRPVLGLNVKSSYIFTNDPRKHLDTAEKKYRTHDARPTVYHVARKIRQERVSEQRIAITPVKTPITDARRSGEMENAVMASSAKAILLHWYLVFPANLGARS
jgi:hypothetical protein